MDKMPDGSFVIDPTTFEITRSAEAPYPLIATLKSGPDWGGDDKHYEHNQRTASAVWRVVHNLRKHPAVSVVDSGGSVVIGEVDYIDENSLTITFTAPFAGKAYCN